MNRIATVLKRIACAAGLALAWAAAFAQAPATAPAASTATRSLDRIVAIVNDEAITETELETRTRVALVQLRRQNINPPPANILRRQVLERMIVDRAMIQLARETGVRVDDATVNAAVARIAEQSGLNPQQFRERLEQQGVSYPRFRADIRDDIVITRLRDREIDSRIQISEGEIDNFLAEQAGVSAGSVEYEIAQILLRVPDNASTERIEATRRQAEELMAQLRSGADFARLAASNSAGSEALSGGSLGWRTAERLPTLFLEAIKGLQPGSLAPLVRSPGGFHILKLVGRRDVSEGRLATGPVEQTRARHILLRVSELTPEAEVRRRLLDLRERVVKGGQDFGQLARLHSVDSTATRGGDLGWIYPGDTVPEFERAMAVLKPGEISQPVQSPFGWHLIQVMERRTDESPTERNRMAARMALRERKAEETYLEWIRQLRDRTYVEYRLDDA
jgi:peptidyl-prolyl cis-trans isomerase SurA